MTSLFLIAREDIQAAHASVCEGVGRVIRFGVRSVSTTQRAAN
jgi:hypothetical protein